MSQCCVECAAKLADMLCCCSECLCCVLPCCVHPQGLPVGHTQPAYPVATPGIRQHRTNARESDAETAARARFALLGNAVTVQARRTKYPKKPAMQLIVCMFVCVCVYVCVAVHPVNAVWRTCGASAPHVAVQSHRHTHPTSC
jgi:hypothetical protein